MLLVYYLTRRDPNLNSSHLHSSIVPEDRAELHLVGSMVYVSEVPGSQFFKNWKWWCPFQSMFPYSLRYTTNNTWIIYSQVTDAPLDRTYVVWGTVTVGAAARASSHALVLHHDHGRVGTDAVLSVGQVTLLWGVGVGTGRVASRRRLLVIHAARARDTCNGTNAARQGG